MQCAFFLIFIRQKEWKFRSIIEIFINILTLQLLWTYSCLYEAYTARALLQIYVFKSTWNVGHERLRYKINSSLALFPNRRRHTVAYTAACFVMHFHYIVCWRLSFSFVCTVVWPIKIKMRNHRQHLYNQLLILNDNSLFFQNEPV